jgi:protein disulfide-isomerase A1
MKQFKELSFAVLSLLAAVSYAEDVASDVKVLQKDTFDSFVSEHPLVLAECK